jgi:hypothetical protein
MTAQHIDDGDQHIDALDRRLHELSATFASLGASDDFEELFQIIHSPGWTTLRDVFFVNALLHAAQRSADDARHLRAALLEGARAISAEPAGMHERDRRASLKRAGKPA